MNLQLPNIQEVVNDIYQISATLYLIYSVVLTLLSALLFRAKTSVIRFVIIVLLGVITLLFIVESNINTYSAGVIAMITSLIATAAYLLWMPSKVGESRFSVPLKTLSGSHCIADIRLGVSIFGASGSGKTKSAICSLIEYYRDNRFTGAINDYKDFELTEVAYPMFREAGIEFSVFALHDPCRTIRINPIAPEYIPTSAHLKSLISNLFDNMDDSDNSGAAKHFKDGAKALFCGVIWRFKRSFPDYCSLPYVISFLLKSNIHDGVSINSKGEEEIRPLARLCEFIREDSEAEILASPFLKAISNEREIGSLQSTLSNLLGIITDPYAFYALSQNDVPLAINAPECRRVISFVNSPGVLSSVITPVNAMLFNLTLLQMSGRKRAPSFILLDEAPTIEIPDLSKMIATLRSFGVSFVYCMQDKIQGTMRTRGNDYKILSILSNLSTQLFGKVNDPKTAEYYVQFFEKVKIEQVSKSLGRSSSGSSRNTTTSYRDDTQIKSSEFFRLLPGEFVMVTRGKETKLRFENIDRIEEMPPILREISDEEIVAQYKKIIEDVDHLFYN